MTPSAELQIVVTPAKAGIHFVFGCENKINLDSRLRGNDDREGTDDRAGKCYE